MTNVQHDNIERAAAKPMGIRKLKQVARQAICDNFHAAAQQIDIETEKGTYTEEERRLILKQLDEEAVRVYEFLRCDSYTVRP